MENREGQVWVEKYRPMSFDNIVLSNINKEILSNIIKYDYFPNLLLYGPPGTGKTTTVINLVNAYQEKHNQKNNGLMIHLNASDERGIDIIRNQINSFVNSKTLFQKGMKFVILDEVDYMTKNAQHALKYLLRGVNGNVRFCLICNYMTRIDDSLQNEFTRLRFNQLPKDMVINFLENISKKENLKVNKETLQSIQEFYKSDIRSMINYMQSNQDILNKQKIIGKKIWDNLTDKIVNETNDEIINYVDYISKNFNLQINNLLKDYLNYIIRNKKELINFNFLKLVEYIMHIRNANMNHIKIYTMLKLKIIYKEILDGKK